MRNPRTLSVPFLFIVYLLLNPFADVKACNAPAISPGAAVRGADAIVRATPLESVGSAGIKFRILEVLKGAGLPPALIVKGSLTKRDDYNEGAVPYRQVRPSGSAPCYASLIHPLNATDDRHFDIQS